LHSAAAWVLLVIPVTTIRLTLMAIIAIRLTDIMVLTMDIEAIITDLESITEEATITATADNLLTFFLVPDSVETVVILNKRR